MQRIVKILVGALAAALACILVAGTLYWTPDRPVEELRGRWAPAPSQFVTISGMQVHLRDEGPREDPVPLVLLHGTSSSLHTWDGWTRVLGRHRRVIRYDMPGFGLTGPAPDGDYSLDSYVRAFMAVLDKLGVEECVAAGNSLGGEVAWAAAVTHPQRVQRLILVDAAGYDFRPVSVPIGFRLARLPILGRFLTYILPRSVIASSVREVYGDPSRVTPELVDRYYDLTTRAGNRQALIERLRQLAPGTLARRIPELRLPTLILWGGRDRLIPPQYGRRFHAEIAGSQLVEFAQLGHVPHEEDPVATAAAVESFLGLPRGASAQSGGAGAVPEEAAR